MFDTHNESSVLRSRGFISFIVDLKSNRRDPFQMIAPLTYKMSQRTMLYLCVGRLILVPWLAMCALHGAKTTAMDDWWAMFLSMVLGVSNGVLGSVPMIVAPSKVPHQFRELTGNIMTLSYSVGLTTGALAAYLIMSWVRRRKSFVTCDMLPPYGQPLPKFAEPGNGTIFKLAIGSGVRNRTLVPLTPSTTPAPISTTASSIATILPTLLVTTISTYLNNLTTVEPNGQS